MWINQRVVEAVISSCLILMGSAALQADTSPASRSLNEIFVNRGTDSLETVKTWLAGNIGAQADMQPKYKSNVKEADLPEVVIFEGEFMPQGNSTQLAVFSDDGVSCEVNGVPIDPQQFKKGQHLPDLTQSLHILSKDGQPFIWEKGKIYRIKIQYSNIIHPDASDIDGCSLIALNGGGNTVTVAIVCSQKAFGDESDTTPMHRLSLEFTPAAMSDEATDFNWTYNAHEPNVNNPAFSYKSPSAVKTRINQFRWYGHKYLEDSAYTAPEGHEIDEDLKWTGNCATPCLYEPLCEVTFGTSGTAIAHLKAGKGLSGKYFYVDVHDEGKTEPPRLMGVNELKYSVDVNKWSVMSEGGLRRRAAKITVLPAKSSQFYEKTLTHETVHKDEFETLKNGTSKYYNAAEFYDAVKGFTSFSKDDLTEQIVSYYDDVFVPAQVRAVRNEFGLLQARELRAYHAQYTVDPRGIRERSDTWIKFMYPE